MFCFPSFFKSNGKMLGVTVFGGGTRIRNGQVFVLKGQGEFLFKSRFLTSGTQENKKHTGIDTCNVRMNL